MSRADQEKILNLFLEQKEIDDPKKMLVILPVVVSLTTGLRIGEVCGLKWDYLDFNKCTIKIFMAGLVPRPTDLASGSKSALVTSSIFSFPLILRDISFISFL